MDWVLPTSGETSAGRDNHLPESPDTYDEKEIESSPLSFEYHHAGVSSCAKIRIYIDVEDPEEVYNSGNSVYYNGAWHIFDGTETFGEFVEIEIGSSVTATGIRIEFAGTVGYYARVHEAQFYGEVAAGQPAAKRMGGVKYAAQRKGVW